MNVWSSGTQGRIRRTLTYESVTKVCIKLNINILYLILMIMYYKTYYWISGLEGC